MNNIIKAVQRIQNMYFRKKRMALFLKHLQISHSTKIIDIGGLTYPCNNWALVPVKPKITIINIERPTVSQDEIIAWVVGTGLQLPFKDKAFDIIFSNSVIEHVGDFEAQKLFADEVKRVGKSFFIQTPNKLFPIEMHTMTPFIHFLPNSWQRKLLKNFTIWGLIERPTTERQEQVFKEINALLGVSEMRKLFPGASILKEKFLGLTKSIIALEKAN